MNIEDQLDAQRELYKQQYQDLSKRFSVLEQLVNETSSLIESTSREHTLTEVAPGFFLDKNSVQQVSFENRETNLPPLINWQPVSLKWAQAALDALRTKPQ